jgi:hypothetical protein
MVLLMLSCQVKCVTGSCEFIQFPCSWTGWFSSQFGLLQLCVKLHAVRVQPFLLL